MLHHASLSLTILQGRSRQAILMIGDISAHYLWSQAVTNNINSMADIIPWCENIATGCYMKSSELKSIYQIDYFFDKMKNLSFTFASPQFTVYCQALRRSMAMMESKIDHLVRHIVFGHLVQARMPHYHVEIPRKGSSWWLCPLAFSPGRTK